MDFVFLRTYRGPLKAVILDWAGTTIDFGSLAPVAVFLQLFERHGVPVSKEDVRSGMGLMKKEHLWTILNRPQVAQAWQEVKGSPPSEADVESLFAEFTTMQIGVLRQYTIPIRGLSETVSDLRRRKLKIGSTTGYLREMMEVVLPEAKKHGYAPDALVCPDEVPAGRPYPWMIYQNLIQLQVYPAEAVVKVGDTLPDIEEGLNAGLWTVGLALSGNLLGLSETEMAALSAEELAAKRETIAKQLYQSGAHYVIDGIWDLPPVLDEIQQRLARGERP
ncbi:MAG: phosphonoacetaldehyde hydrolase [Anaerolineales bacterium]|nr:phosphonoacetaldehyde hydrolase [Anaerolineales bacterium]MCS7248902.1 phosphonoacetaldehyde hydrolase [Anaerolineales bacterium]MDW8162715.1 phosphonoacetaldehyde hydrolase [Anaerolineales bacterium]MDW8446678.1 phosphonoacetaldehyde hydrolase [Anaerolineales bacterium]